jgi:hypothetical protein
MKYEHPTWLEKTKRASHAINKLTNGTLEYVPHLKMYECVFTDEYKDDGKSFTEMASVVILTDVDDTKENRHLAMVELDKIIHVYAEDLSYCMKQYYKELEGLKNG